MVFLRTYSNNWKTFAFWKVSTDFMCFFSCNGLSLTAKALQCSADTRYCFCCSCHRYLLRFWTFPTTHQQHCPQPSQQRVATTAAPNPIHGRQDNNDDDNTTIVARPSSYFRCCAGFLFDPAKTPHVLSHHCLSPTCISFPTNAFGCPFQNKC